MLQPDKLFFVLISLKLLQKHCKTFILKRMSAPLKGNYASLISEFVSMPLKCVNISMRSL